MGGGAGIVFELYLNSGDCILSRGKLTNWRLSVDYFDAHGYMDGWSHIDGKYLKVTHVSVQDERQIVEGVKERGYKSGDMLDVYQDQTRYNRQGGKFTIFSGYVRGDYRNCFPVNVEFQVVLAGYECRAIVTVEPAKGFQGMYKDVFDDWCKHGTSWTGRKWEKR